MKSPALRPARAALLSRTALAGASGAALWLALAGAAEAQQTPVGLITGTTPSSGGQRPQITTPDGAAPDAADQVTNINVRNPRTVIDWATFLLEANDTLNFSFNARGDIVLNRIAAGSQAQILGELNARVGADFGGNVWFQAPGGVLFGNSAVVNVGGLMATTGVIDIADFRGAQGGDLNYSFASAAAGRVEVQSGASILAAGGTIALIAPEVATAAGSSVGGGATSDVLYGAAQNFTITFQDDGSDLALLSFVVPGDALTNGSASAAPLAIAGTTDAGTVFVAAVSRSAATASISLGGLVTATSAAADGGDIVLSAGGGIVNRAAGPAAGQTVDAVIGDLGGGADVLTAADDVSLRANGVLTLNDADVTATDGEITLDADSVVANGTAAFDAAQTTVDGVLTLGSALLTATGALTLDDLVLDGAGAAREIDAGGALSIGGGVTDATADTHDLILRGDTVAVNEVGVGGRLASATFDGPTTLSGGVAVLNAAVFQDTLFVTDPASAGDVRTVSAGSADFADVRGAPGDEGRLLVDVTGAAIFNGDIGTAGDALGRLGVRADTVSFGGTNRVGVLAADIANGGLAFTNGPDLTVGEVGSITGVTVAAGGATLETTSGDIQLDEAVDVSGQALVLQSAGTIDQAAGAVITADTLTTDSTGGTSLEAANVVTTILAMDNAGSGDLSFTSAGALTASGDITNTGGSVVLTGGAVSLASVSGDDGVTITGDTIGADTITAGGAGAVIDIEATAGGIVVAEVSAPGGDVSLTATTTIDVTAVEVDGDYAISAQDFLGGVLTPTGDVDDLTIVDTLGDFTFTDLTAGEDLSVTALTGAVTGVSATAQTGSVTLEGTSVTLTGAVTAEVDATITAATGAVALADVTADTGSVRITGAGVTAGALEADLDVFVDSSLGASVQAATAGDDIFVVGAAGSVVLRRAVLAADGGAAGVDSDGPGTLDSGGDIRQLSVTAGAGFNVTLGQDAGLAPGAANDVTVAAGETFEGRLAGDAVDVTLDQSALAGGAFDVDARAGAATVVVQTGGFGLGEVTTAGNLTVDILNGELRFGTIDTVGDVGLSASAALTGGDVTATGAIALSGRSVVTGAADAGTRVTATSSDGQASLASASATDDIIVQANGGSATLGAATLLAGPDPVRTVTVSASGANADAVLGARAGVGPANTLLVEGLATVSVTSASRDAIVGLSGDFTLDTLSADRNVAVDGAGGGIVSIDSVTANTGDVVIRVPDGTVTVTTVSAGDDIDDRVEIVAGVVAIPASIDTSGDLVLEATAGGLTFGDLSAPGKLTLLATGGALVGDSATAAEGSVRVQGQSVTLGSATAGDDVFVVATTGGVSLGTATAEDDVFVVAQGGTATLGAANLIADTSPLDTVSDFGLGLDTGGATRQVVVRATGAGGDAVFGVGVGVTPVAADNALALDIGADPLAIQVTSLSRDAVIRLDNVDGGDPLTLASVTAARDVDILLQVGDVSVTTLSAPDDATVVAAGGALTVGTARAGTSGPLVDGEGDGSNLSLSASGDLRVTTARADADVTLSSTGGDITITTLAQAGDDLTIGATGSLFAQNADLIAAESRLMAGALGRVDVGGDGSNVNIIVADLGGDDSGGVDRRGVRSIVAGNQVFLTVTGGVHFDSIEICADGVAGCGLDLAFAAGGDVTGRLVSAPGDLEISAGGDLTLTTATAGDDLNLSAGAAGVLDVNFAAALADPLFDADDEAAGTAGAGSNARLTGGTLRLRDVRAGADVTLIALTDGVGARDGAGADFVDVIAGDDVLVEAQNGDGDALSLNQDNIVIRTVRADQARAEVIGGGFADVGDDGADIRLTGRADITVTTAAARGDLTADAGRDLILTTGRAGGDIVLTAGGDLIGTSWRALDDLSSEATGTIDITEAQAADDLRLVGQSIDAGAFLARRGAVSVADQLAAGPGFPAIDGVNDNSNIVVLAAGALVLGSADANGSVTLTAGSRTDGAVLAPGADLTVAGAITAGDDVALRAGRDITLATVEALRAAHGTAPTPPPFSDQGPGGSNITVQAGRDLTATRLTAGDDVRASAGDALTATTVQTTGEGADGELDGANVVLTGASLQIGVAQAADDVVARATVGGARFDSIAAGDDAFVTAARDAVVGSLRLTDAGLNRDSDGAGTLDAGSAERRAVISAGENAVLGLATGAPTAGSNVLTLVDAANSAVSVLAGGNASVRVASAVTLQRVQAGGDVVVQGEGAVTVRAIGDDPTGVEAAGDARLFASGPLVANSVIAGDDLTIFASTTLTAEALRTTGLGVDAETDGANIRATAGTLDVALAEAAGDLVATTFNSTARFGRIVAGDDVFVTSERGDAIVEALRLSDAGPNLDSDGTGTLDAGTAERRAVINGNIDAVLGAAVGPATGSNTLTLDDADNSAVSVLASENATVRLSSAAVLQRVDADFGSVIIDAADITVRGVGDDPTEVGASDDATLTASGDIDVNRVVAGGGATLTAVGQITVDTVSAAADATLTSTGAGIDAGFVTARLDATLTALGPVSIAVLNADRDAVVTSTTGAVTIGTADAIDDLTVTAATILTADSLRTTGFGPDAETDGANIRTTAASMDVALAEAGGDLVATTTAGTARFGRIVAGDDAFVTAAGGDAIVEALRLSSASANRDSDGPGALDAGTADRRAVIAASGNAVLGAAVGPAGLANTLVLDETSGSPYAVSVLAGANATVRVSTVAELQRVEAIAGDVVIDAASITVVGFGDDPTGVLASGDAALTAPGEIIVNTVTAGADATLTSGASIDAESVAAGLDATLTANQSLILASVVAGRDATLSATLGDVTVTTLASAGDDLRVTAGGTADLDSAVVTGAGTDTEGDGFIVQVDAGTIDVRTATSATPLGGVRLTAVNQLTADTVNAGRNASLTSTAGAIEAATVLAGGDATLSAATLVSIDTVDATGDVLIDSDDAITSATLIQAGGDATLAAGGQITIASVNAGANATLTSTGAGVEAATVTAGGDATLTAATAVTVTGLLDAAGAVTVSAGADQRFGALDAGAGLTLTSDGAVTVDGFAVAGGDFTVTSDGGQSFGGIDIAGDASLTSGAGVTITGQDAGAPPTTLASTVGGDFFVVTGTTDAATFNGDVAVVGEGRIQAGDMAIGETGSLSVGTTLALESLRGKVALGDGIAAADTADAFTLSEAEFGRITAPTLDVYAGSNDPALAAVSGDLVVGDLSFNTVAATGEGSVQTLNLLARAENEVRVVGVLAPNTRGDGRVLIGLQSSPDWTPGAILVTGSIGSATATGELVNRDSALTFDSVELNAQQDIIIGTDDIFVEQIQTTEPGSINLTRDRPFAPLLNENRNTVLIAADTLTLRADGKIVQQNTGGVAGRAQGIYLDNDPLSPSRPVLTIGRTGTGATPGGEPAPAIVELFLSFRDSSGNLISRSVAAPNPGIVLEANVDRSNRLRVNGCVIGAAGNCTPLADTVRIIEPERLLEGLVLVSQDDEDEDDPTITGAGNEEIWRTPE